MKKSTILSVAAAALMIFAGAFTCAAQSKVIFTGEIGKKVIGYEGTTPLHITIENGKITKIEADANKETPRYFKKATGKIFPQYIGKTVDEALKMKVDAVTGATYSSKAIIENIKLGLLEAKKGAKASTTKAAKTTKKAKTKKKK